jgi:hypothetical protein
MIILTIVVVQLPYSLRTISDLEKAAAQKYQFLNMCNIFTQQKLSKNLF